MPKKDTPLHQRPSSISARNASPPVSDQEQLRRYAATVLQRIQATPDAPLTPQDVLVLQRTVGNHAVQRILTSASATDVIQRNPHKRKREDDDEEEKRKKKKKRYNDAQDRLIRTNERNQEGKAIPKTDRHLRDAQVRHSYGFNDTEIDEGFMKGRFRRGWGAQPFLSVNKNDYDGSTVKTDYDALVDTIEGDEDHSEKKMARDALKFIEKGKFDEDDYDADSRRALSTLVQLTQVIESHKSRVPGADKLGRASLRRIKDGNSTFRKEFNRKSGNFVPARAKAGGSEFGGQDAGRTLFGVESKKSDKSTKKDILTRGVVKTIDYLSDSSDEERSDSEDDSIHTDDEDSGSESS